MQERDLRRAILREINWINGSLQILQANIENDSSPSSLPFESLLIGLQRTRKLASFQAVEGGQPLPDQERSW